MGAFQKFCLQLLGVVNSDSGIDDFPLTSSLSVIYLGDSNGRMSSVAQKGERKH